MALYVSMMKLKIIRSDKQCLITHRINPIRNTGINNLNLNHNTDTNLNPNMVTDNHLNPIRNTDMVNHHNPSMVMVNPRSVEL